MKSQDEDVYMGIYQFKSLKPNIFKDVYIAKSADIIGDVTLSSGANVWFNTVLRGDINRILIGENTNVQDLSILHVTREHDVVVGKNVTIGHSVTLHGATIGDGSLIGMGATILDGATIGKNSLVAAGSLVSPGKSFPDGSFIIGSPAKLKRALTAEEIEQFSNHYKSYVKNAKDFKDELVELL